MHGKAAQGQAQLASVRGEGYSPARWGKDQFPSSTNPSLQFWSTARAARPAALAGQRAQHLSGARRVREPARGEWTFVKRGTTTRTGERGHVRQG